MTQLIARPYQPWWHVSGHADAAHRGQGIRHHLHIRAGRAAPSAARRGGALDGQVGGDASATWCYTFQHPLATDATV
jgi:hypothetical protein